MSCLCAPSSILLVMQPEHHLNSNHHPISLNCDTGEDQTATLGAMGYPHQRDEQNLSYDFHSPPPPQQLCHHHPQSYDIHPPLHRYLAAKSSTISVGHTA